MSTPLPGADEAPLRGASPIEEAEPAAHHPHAQDERIDGRPEVLAHWRAGLLALPQRPLARSLVIADIDLGDWPLADAEVLEALGAWLRLPGRTLTLLLRDPEQAARQSSRFGRWRRDYSHVVRCLGPGEATHAALIERWPQGMATEEGVSERVPGAVWRLRVRRQPTVPQGLWRPWLQECESCWPAHTLGL